MAKFEPKQFGKYVLLEKLAVGGMAEIYKAKTYGAEGFEKLLAIKRILPHAAADKEFINMLIDEAKLSVLLSHANIVQVYDLGKVGDDYFISMEYIHGVNLRDVLYHLREKSRKMPTDLACYVTSEICKGLDYAHRKTDSNNQTLGIVHRDISPQNILISYEGEVKIVDFGIAKAAMNISHTMAGILKGKIAYMSPEQAMGKSIDSRTDIFSLGIILYESLTGKKLYTGESQFEVLKKIRTTRIETGKLPENIPEPLKPILAKALAYRPEERYSSSSDMQIALTKYLYATFTDFSPRKLAQFVKELFVQEIKEEPESSKGLEGKTSSISLLGGTAQQENIVHRETAHMKESKLSAVDETKPVTAVKSITVTKTKRWQAKRLPLFAAASILLVLGIGYATWKILKKPVQPTVVEKSETLTGTIQVVSQPAGALISLDGTSTQLQTPAILENVTLNQDHVINLTLENYGSATKTIQLTNTEPYTLELSLVKNVGLLNVISEPPGAAILVNDIATGKSTPDILDNLILNTEYKITLSKPDYLDVEQSVTLSSTTPQKILASLNPIQKPLPPVTPPVVVPPVVVPPVVPPVVVPPVVTKPEQAPVEPKPKTPAPKTAAPVVKPKKEIEVGEGSIKITSDPSGADIFVNGEHGGTTPATVKTRSGSVRLLVSKGEDKIPCRGMVQVKPGDTTSFNCSLGGLYGKIMINTTPPRAEVFLDGKKLGGKTPLSVEKIKRDKAHTLRLELEGFRPWEQPFDLEDKESKLFNVDLEK
ncbi:MAG: hypothetical protein A3H42_01360 [Deltaproteobacteria bacterium RIFCSPLOWO2_02_FULL_46_8]|nr:MAG: hypothetical protein A3H42_01360 [Deltaproteobacteria bacterium RIFCSPLOWO2_02_FULL_46_8]